MSTTSAGVRREQAKAEYNAYLAQCPSRQVLASISNKWVTLLLVALSDGPQRYSQLARQLAGVSQKMLTQSLRSLERDGLVERVVEATVPVTVTYSLTPLGRSLHEVVRGVKLWAETNIEQIHGTDCGFSSNWSAGATTCSA